jgi:hypothetical protein
MSKPMRQSTNAHSSQRGTGQGLRVAEALIELMAWYAHTQKSQGPHGCVTLTEGMYHVQLDHRYGSKRFCFWLNGGGWYINDCQTNHAFGAETLPEAVYFCTNHVNYPVQVKPPRKRYN